MTVHSDLMAAILADPRDDGPRLVMADWLDEHGEPEKSEFIRVQIELAKLPEPDQQTLTVDEAARTWTYCSECLKIGGEQRCRYHALEDRQKELWDAHWLDWFPDFFDPRQISRGFPSSVSMTLRQFVGGPCERCVQGASDYRDRNGEYVGTEPCPHCHNGTIPGLVDTLANRWPVTEVRLTDREPVIVDGTVPYAGWWIWWSGDGTEMASEIPPVIFPKQVRGKVWNFPSRESALAALSQACVSLTRKRAGLKKLKWR